jgi:rhodanese-related sulfurtransferase
MRSALSILIGWQCVAGVALLPASATTVADLVEMLAGSAKVTVIDVRSPLAYGEEHIPGAINIPASVCPAKNLPPMGTVLVCGDGLGGDDDAVAKAALALSSKPGIKAEVLEGGFAAWKTSHGQTTHDAGFKRESLNYTTYAHVKTMQHNSVVLLDMRKPARLDAVGLTDLNVEFAGMKRVTSLAEATRAVAGLPPLIVLIDNGDGASEAMARRLKASGNHRYVILAGGEKIIARHGQAGLQRNAPVISLPPNKTLPAGAPK